MSIQTHDKLSRTELEHLSGDERVVVNAGCGRDDRGIGIDIHYEPDIQHDLNDGLPLADGSVDRLICEHVLEHLDNPSQFLAEAGRVLRDDGVLEIEIPNAGWWPVRLWLSQDLHRFWSHKNPEREGHWLARRLGNDDAKRTAHRSLWTPALLEEHLERAGLEYRIDDTHWSRNIAAEATPESDETPGQTLHELERAAGDDLASGDYWARTRSRIMAGWVSAQDPDRVVDVGCGSGYLTARIAADTPSAEVVGLDSDTDSIAVARRRDCTATFAVGDAFDLDYADDSVDVVVFGDVLEHLADPTSALAEARRVLARDGVVIVSVPAFRALWGPHDEHNDHHDRYNRDRLATLANGAGFALTRSRYTNLAPLPVYWLYQRVLKRQVPQGARGGHDGALERLKRLAIDAEVGIDWPVGITLIAELEAR